mgnify:CR=1 FL=1
MLFTYKFIKFYNTSSFVIKSNNIKKELVKLSPKNSALIGATESHALPLKVDEFIKKCKDDFFKREKKEN